MLKAQWHCLLPAARRVFNHTALRTPGAMAFCSIGCLLVLVAQYGLTEPVVDSVPSLHTAEPGGNITLKCGADPNKINQYAHARVTWYRQEPDGRIQIVTTLSTGYLKEGRYSGTVDNKNGQYNLTIAGLHRTDSAVYFCIARAALLFAPGSSTKLVVSDCVPVLFYGLPAVLLLILVVVSVACVYRRLHKTKTDHKSSDAPCRPQRPARHRTVQDYSTEYASLNL
ncbi:uncharacterized protein LOC117965163 [Acipenser ruthenus]|uniref:uncharacterized protein LOC117965163 n=1 Tax=Acipenser ruthenus TaxID=7906 RepID=UPI00274134C4|nr:uncharacterized protein LOC117965163 [Acipenser ruthenus]